MNAAAANQKEVVVITLRMRNALVGLISAVWALNMFLPSITGRYERVPEVNAIFGAMVGVVLVTSKGDKEESQ